MLFLVMSTFVIVMMRLCGQRNTNDRIATQRYLTPEIPIGSRVMSRTTSAPTGGRARMVVAIIAGCRSFRTFRDCHASIAFTTVGAQPNLKRMFGQIWDRFEPQKKLTHPTPGGARGVLGGKKFKCPGNVMNCPENQYFFLNPTTPQRVQAGILGVQKSVIYHGLPRESIIFF